MEPTEEQALLGDMVARFLADHTPPEGAGHASMPAEQWAALGELGVLALVVPEEAGGLGGGPVEVALVGEALGRAAAMTPMAEVAILSARVLAADGGETAGALLSSLIEGHAIVAFAGGGDGPELQTSADGQALNGERRLVRHGAAADAFVVETTGPTPGLYLIRADAPGLTVQPYLLADGEMAARLVFKDVLVGAAERLGVDAASYDRAVALAQLCVVSEMIGMMQTLYDATIDYVRERRQFGVPIASFQVVQHRAARLFVLIEQSRSMLLRAVHAEADAFGDAVTEARAYVSEAALRLAQDATQLHGGMGVTQELLVGRGHRRLLVLSRLFGGPVGAREALAA